MTTIVTRQTGTTSVNRPLTNTEIDNNFINLNTDKVDKLESYSNPEWITSLSETKVLPSQTGNDGKLLTTNGATTSWTSAQTFLTSTSYGEVTDVYYVSKNGNDSNNGKTLETSFLTIKAACAVAAPLVAATPSRRISIHVKAGDYTEANPVTIPPRVAILGDSLRTVSIRPGDTTKDTFYVNNGSYVYGVTFRSHLSPCAAVSFNPDGSAGNIVTSPYVQNCSSITTTGCGMRVNGSYVSGTRGMVTDAYTQFNQGGIGIHVLNRGYAQLVSIFTICTSTGVLCEAGGQCSITNSNSSFGTYGLVATGKSAALDTGTSGAVNLSANSMVVSGLTYRPATNDVIQFSDVVSAYSGFYTIDYASPLVSGSCTITIQENIPLIPEGKTFTTYKRSLITASGQAFEYVGAGTDISTALPELGGIPIQENEVVMSTGGKVYYTSTDHKGDFRIGDGVAINNATGTISGRAFITSLFSNMAPYMLALS